MKTQYLLVLLSFAFISCNGQTQKSNNDIAAKDQLESYEYIFSNDTLTQKAKIVFKSKNQILFTLTTINKKRNMESTFSDTASIRNTPGADNVQAYEDELQSDMYPAKEYIYNKKCYLTIGIDSKTKARLFVVETQGCKILGEKNCPFGSLGTLRKK
jgi:hypothetical protein